jgi:hypothetical protein
MNENDFKKALSNLMELEATLDGATSSLTKLCIHGDPLTAREAAVIRSCISQMSFSLGVVVDTLQHLAEISKATEESA